MPTKSEIRTKIVEQLLAMLSKEDVPRLAPESKARIRKYIPALAELEGAEEEDLHGCLDDWSVPRVWLGSTLSVSERISLLGQEREGVSQKLADVWIHLDSWARGEAQSMSFIEASCQSILKNQAAPGWKNS